jgi:outer membrane murein-binding lipoprotein Lpp
MYMKKTLLASAILGSTLIIAGCETIPKEQHEQELSNQQAKYEQQIKDLQATKQSTPVPAQSAVVENQLFPPNAQPGHCYSRVLTPAIYETKSERVLVKPETETVSIVPSQYKDATERLLVKEESTKIVAVPATYKTVSERVEVKPAHTHLKTVAATYKTVSERVIDKPAHTAWKRGAGFQSSALETRIDNGTGEIMCLVEVPATYKTIKKTVIDTPAQTLEEHHKAEYKVIQKRVVSTPATTKTIVIPAVYKEVSVKRLVSAEKEARTTIPAVYKTVTSKEKVGDEQLMWAEVLCEDNMTPATVSNLQELLNKAGKYNGPIDGVYGPLTERAANSYAKANDLPTGSRLISLETAKHIGLNL